MEKKDGVSFKSISQYSRLCQLLEPHQVYYHLVNCPICLNSPAEEFLGFRLARYEHTAISYNAVGNTASASPSPFRLYRPVSRPRSFMAAAVTHAGTLSPDGTFLLAFGRDGTCFALTILIMCTPSSSAPSVLSSAFFRLDLRALESVKQGSNLTEVFFKGRGIGIMDSGESDGWYVLGCGRLLRGRIDREPGPYYWRV